jgi:diacylglycerol kinase family enzyme
LPLGTANVFARELGIPFDLPEAWAIIREGKEARVDLGLAEYAAAPGPRHRYFAQLGGAGLDARSVELLDYNQKRYLGSLAYIIAGLKAIQEQKPLILVEGPSQYSGELVLLGNGRLYGGPFVLFPHADIKDGLLDATIFPRADFATLFRVGRDFLNGQWEGVGGSIQIQTPCLTLKPNSGQRIPFELDGDNVGYLPATFTACPKLLRVVC